MSYGTALTIGATGLVTSSQGSAPSKASYPLSSQLGQRCCDTGRPIMADPTTGQTICSCQLKTGTQAYLSRVPSLPESIYGAGTSPVFSPTSLLGTEPSAFYPMANLPTSEALKAGTPGGHSPYYFDGLLAANPYNSFYPGLDLNSAARRKNATRETTSALKAWLYEHRKNPYPTKGEKIMLAIITRMTLTQVSTWFANARRRLKKESKINWNSKDDDVLDGDMEDKESKDDSITSRLSSDEDEDEVLKVSSDLSDISDVEDGTSRPPLPRKCVQRLFSPELRTERHPDTSVAIGDHHHHQHEQTSRVSQQNNFIGVNLRRDSVDTEASTPRDKSVAGNTSSAANSSVPATRPKIWSISEIIGSSPKSSRPSNSVTTCTSTTDSTPQSHRDDADVSFKSLTSDQSDSSFTSPDKADDSSVDRPISLIPMPFIGRN